MLVLTLRRLSALVLNIQVSPIKIQYCYAHVAGGLCSATRWHPRRGEGEQEFEQGKGQHGVCARGHGSEMAGNARKERGR